MGARARLIPYVYTRLSPFSLPHPLLIRTHLSPVKKKVLICQWFRNTSLFQPSIVFGSCPFLCIGARPFSSAVFLVKRTLYNPFVFVFSTRLSSVTCTVSSGPFSSVFLSPFRLYRSPHPSLVSSSFYRISAFHPSFFIVCHPPSVLVASALAQPPSTFSPSSTLHPYRPSPFLSTRHERLHPRPLHLTLGQVAVVSYIMLGFLYHVLSTSKGCEGGGEIGKGRGRGKGEGMIAAVEEEGRRERQLSHNTNT